MKAQRRGRYAGLAILVAICAGLAAFWLFRQPPVNDVQLGASAPPTPDSVQLPNAAAAAAETASAEDAADDQPPADCLAALAAPDASSRMLRQQRQWAVDRFLEQQGDERQRALIADLAGYTLPASEVGWGGFTYVAWARYKAPISSSERELTGDERQRLRTLLETEGVEALIASVDAAVLQAYWTPGTSLIAYLMQEHGEGLWAALPAVADSLPLGMHGLAAAIANGVPAADFALLLEAADVDPAATWLNGANLAKVAAIHRRPEILRLLTARGVDAVVRPRWGYGTILDDIAARAEPESAADTEALAEVVRQLTAAGAQPDLPSTLRTLAERLPGVALPRLNPEAAALADSLGDVVAAFAALDADWMQKIDAADRLEQRCEAQLADFEGSAAAFQATDLAAKQRYQEVLRKRLERMWEEWQRKADEQRAAAADEAPADRRGEDELYDALLLATQDDQWQDAVALADQMGGNAHRILLEMALGSDAPLDVVLELVQRHGSLPESAMQTIGFRRGDAAIAEALEPFGLDVHYVDEEGHNAFTRLARNFMGTEHEWRLAEYLASRSVAVKPRPFGLDPLDRVLMDIVASPRVDSEAGVGFARFLIEHGAPVEASHLELAGQLLAKDEEAYRRLVYAVPELASRVPGG